MYPNKIRLSKICNAFNVDNTADEDKPVSKAARLELDDLEDRVDALDDDVLALDVRTDALAANFDVGAGVNLGTAANATNIRGSGVSVLGPLTVDAQLRWGLNAISGGTQTVVMSWFSKPVTVFKTSGQTYTMSGVVADGFCTLLINASGGNVILRSSLRPLMRSTENRANTGTVNANFGPTPAPNNVGVTLASGDMRLLVYDGFQFFISQDLNI